MEASDFAPPPDRVPLRRALISVSDKSGLAPFAEALARRGVEIVSSGGTARTLRKGGLAPTDVSDVTGFPEILDGRVKTLHPFIHAGILAVRNAPAHLAALEAHKIAPFDLVVSNLYPFEKMVEAGATTVTAIEAIDIGGPALIRAAAKNHGFVAVAVDPGDYDGLLAELDAQDGATTLVTRRRLAAKAFARTAAYDTAIAQWLAEETGEHDTHWRSFSGRLSSTMRYGENPHQAAAFYRSGRRAAGIAAASLVQAQCYRRAYLYWKEHGGHGRRQHPRAVCFKRRRCSKDGSEDIRGYYHRAALQGGRRDSQLCAHRLFQQSA
jgi:phosphoribosylaminoimidazolecarboxamide formyltransferase/IMP cyclohydrolase